MISRLELSLGLGLDVFPKVLTLINEVIHITHRNVIKTNYRYSIHVIIVLPLLAPVYVTMHHNRYWVRDDVELPVRSLVPVPQRVVTVTLLVDVVSCQSKHKGSHGRQSSASPCSIYKKTTGHTQIRVRYRAG